ncbi:sensor histidine kinase [Sulfurimonas sp.]
MSPTKNELDNFKSLITLNEEWLMTQILKYAEKNDYTKYTSTLTEAWRVSIEGLSTSLIELLNNNSNIPELHPEDDYSQDPASKFGLEEAKKHRSRGVNLSMFLGLFKYYRESYQDLLKREADKFENIEFFKLYIDRFFDRTEIAYCSEWAGLSSEKQIQELSKTNLNMTNEKNKYLTIFDSFGSPAVILDKEGYVENFNLAAEKVFRNSKISGKEYYKQTNTKEKFIWLDDEINRFINSKQENKCFEKKYEEIGLYFDIKISKLNDVSNKFVGFTVLMNDITTIIEQERLLIQQSRLAAMGEMLNMLAHQWRQPIAVISMAVNNMLLDLELGMTDEEQLKVSANDISEQTTLLSKTIDDFKDYFKPDEEKATISLNNIIDNTISILNPILKNNNITIVKEFSDTSNITTYSKELEQVLINIINNSHEAFQNREQSKKIITIKLYESDVNIIIDIIDNAGGIPENIIYSIFKPYFSTKQEKNGKGIGLYMSDTIVKKHLNGNLIAKNIDNGAKFTIELPIAIH